MPVADPTFEIETELFGAGAPVVIGIDEVGRGALAGPVAVGAVALEPRHLVSPFPAGLRDSKMLSEKRREALYVPLQEWAAHWSVGLATAGEIDEWGITRCLGMAASRALSNLHIAGARVSGSTVLLDGSQDWLNPVLSTPLEVRVRTKADRDCVSVAAASVLAKVTRDRLMAVADESSPQFGWASNKGYGSAVHLAAIAQHGPSELHRLSWLH